MAARLFLSGHIDVPDDRVVSVRAAVGEHIRLSRAEPGCLSFDITPCPDVPGRFLVAESFASRQAFDAHQARARASDWGKITQGIERHFEIREGAA